MAQNTRDKLIISFYGDTGCRASELLAIHPKDIDFKNGNVLIPHLKRGTHKHCPKCNKVGGRNTVWCSKCGNNLSKVEAIGVEERHRIISLGADLTKQLRDYTKGMQPDDLVINLSRQAVYYIIRDLATKAGLDGEVLLNPSSGKTHHVHPHIFRSSLAVDWLKVAGSDVNKQKALQDHLGHKSFDTTMGYNVLSPSQVKSVGDEVRKMRGK